MDRRASPPVGTTVVADGLAFAEAPRWHAGTLWWADMHAGEVKRLGLNGVETVCTVPMRPSGLGWLPDGRLLVVSMMDKRVLRLEPDGSLSTHADLSDKVPRRLNDMIVDQHGRAYVGNFGFEIDGAEPPKPTVLMRVDLNGQSCIAARDLLFPNGMAITADGGTLIVAETWAARLTAFVIGADGGLTHRRVWATLPDGAVPDGICLDKTGALWVASPTTQECICVREGGEVLRRIPTGRGAFACALGGIDGRVLFICTAASHDHERQKIERNGRVEAVRVATPGQDFRSAGGASRRDGHVWED